MTKIVVRMIMSVSVVLGAVIAFPATASAYEPTGELNAKRIYTEYADKSSGTPPSSDCISLYVGADRVGRVCFEQHGDEFWVNDDSKDGRHIEMRGTINTTADGYICKGSGSLSLGWQVCNSFKDTIPDGGNSVLRFAASLWNGNDQIKVSDFHYANT